MPLPSKAKLLAETAAAKIPSLSEEGRHNWTGFLLALEKFPEPATADDTEGV